MKRKLMTSSVIASLMLVAGAAVAADPVSVSGGTVHFEGELVNAACAVSTQSSDQVVTLGQYRTASFAAVGDTTAQIPFSIVLNDCDPKVAATAAVAFSGQSDITNNNLLAVTSADNGTTASGVGIEILDNTSTALKPDGATFYRSGSGRRDQHPAFLCALQSHCHQRYAGSGKCRRDVHHEVRISRFDLRKDDVCLTG